MSHASTIACPCSGESIHLDPNTNRSCESPLPDGLIHLVTVRNVDSRKSAKFLIGRGGEILDQGVLAPAGAEGDQFTRGVSGGANLKVANLSDNEAILQVSLESFAQ
ncbi:hypothetical protein [Polyangium sorediatum]|uniref:Uncharacterized protein n=1 Tax=Polyangium sorediatum TaxID=889274 RepID=A0ABT6P9Y7_9BACT|nr:hypothetical protein [Polyangium sorediatum]MDI1437445.1 hypothetical protein [Polyangium sorediatum]